MTATIKDSIKIAIFIAAILLVAGVIVPFLIKAFCWVLLIIFTKPVIALVASGSFLLGMFLNEKLSKQNK
jgi:multisubunit Na+/H+ antiporter MnhG subunit